MKEEDVASFETMERQPLGYTEENQEKSQVGRSLS
jgi:hypothetical protein